MSTCPRETAGHHSIETLLQCTTASAGFAREQFPWESIARWTHTLPKNPTSVWLDSYKGGPWHRWKNHHPIDFVKAWWADDAGQLRIGDYLVHIHADVITTNGLPALPECIHQALRSSGIPFEILVRWTHFNIFDVAVGGIAVTDGAHTLWGAVHGHLPWEGAKTFIFTFGLGTVEIAAGWFTENPLLIAGGASHVSAGAVSAWQYIHSVSPSAWESLMPLASYGLEVGLAAGVLRTALIWRRATPRQRAVAAAESFALGITASALVAYSIWFSSGVSATYASAKFAWTLAAQDEAAVLAVRFSSASAYARQCGRLRDNGKQVALDRFVARWEGVRFRSELADFWGPQQRSFSKNANVA